MGRRKGATTETAHIRKTAIIQMRSQGLSLSAIAAELKCSRAYVVQVSNGANLPRISPQTILDWIMVYKTTNPSAGADIVLWRARQHFGDQADIPYPSSAKLERIFKAENKTCVRVGGRKDKRHFWNSDKPTNHGEIYKCDLYGPITIGGRNYEVFACIDMASRIIWGELLPSDYVVYLPWALRQSYQAMGKPPTQLWCDNGIGLILTGRKSLGSFVRQAFTMGTAMVHYIPTGQPQRNGHIESFNRTMAREFILPNEGKWGSIEEARARFRAWLIEYNTERPHSSLQHRTPHTAGTFTPPAAEEPKVITVPKEAHGTVSYSRLVDNRGIAVISTPDILYILDVAVSGAYVRLDIDWKTKQGKVLSAKKEIGTFTYTGERTITPTLDPVLTAVTPSRRYDETSYLRQQSKHLKRRITSYPKGYELRDLPEGWELIDIRTGEIILTQETSYADHTNDIGIVIS